VLKAKTIRKSYGKPWSKILGDIPVDEGFLKGIGEIILKEVVHQARRDLARQGNRKTSRKMPEGIPVDEKFFKSFDFKVAGRSTIEITSTWPWIEQIIEGRNKFRMVWLTRERGVGIVPLEPEAGKVLFRWAPERKENAWIHPGFHRHNFVQRAIRNVKKDIDQYMADYIVQAISSTPKSYPG